MLNNGDLLEMGGPSMSAWERFTALTGAIGSVLMFAAVSTADPYSTGLDPDPTDPSSLLARALVQHRDRIRLGSYLILLAAFFVIWFVSYLYARLRTADGADGWEANMVVIGGALLAGLLLLEGGFGFAASEIADYGSDTQVAKMLHLWGWNSASLMATPFAAILLGTAALGFRSKTLRPWVSWMSAVFLVLLLVISAVLKTPGLGAGFGALWLVVTSVALAIGKFARPGSNTA